MKTATQEILIDIKNLLTQNYPDEVINVILFGSQSKGELKNDSDFDILVVLKNTVSWKKEKAINDLFYQVDLKYGIVTDTHILSEKEMESVRGKQPVYINALTNGIYA
jgi:predicted nucleotidyltransferase